VKNIPVRAMNRQVGGGSPRPTSGTAQTARPRWIDQGPGGQPGRNRRGVLWSGRRHSFV